MIPGAETLPRNPGASSRDFCDRHLGKGVVPCKDTPNFIANRIGSFFGSTVHKLTVEDGLHHRRSGRAHRPADRAAQERQLPPAGYRRPRRLGASSRAICTTRCRTIPGATASCCRRFCEEMMERGWLGDKTRPGLLQARRQGTKRSTPSTGRRWSIIRRAKPHFPSVEAARNIEDLARAAAHAGRRRRPRRHVPVEAVQRSVPLLRQHGAGDFRPHRRDRSRHALGLRQQAGTVRAVGCAGLRSHGAAHRERAAAHCRRTSSACSASGAKIVLSAGRSATAARTPSTSTCARHGLPARSKPGPAFWCSPTSSARAAWSRRTPARR